MQKNSALFFFILLICTISLFAQKAVNAPIFYRSGAQIVIDGNDRDWPQSAEWIQLSYANTGDGLEDQKGFNDYMGQFKAFYDPSTNHLYIYATISDNVLTPKVSKNQKGWIWDRLEVFIDGRNSKSNDTELFDQFVISPVSSKAVLLNGSESADKQFIECQTKYKSRAVTYEMKIYLYANRKFNWPLKVKDGSKIGFDIAYCDNDGDNFGKSGSYFSWSPGVGKHLSSGSYGTLEIYSSVSAYEKKKQESDKTQSSSSFTYSLDDVEGIISSGPKKPAQQKQRAVERQLDWFTDYAEAVKKAETLNKELFIYFYTDIPRCTEFENQILTIYKQRIFTKYIGLKLDIKSSMNYAQIYKVFQIPSIVISQKDGTMKESVQANNTGLEKLFY